MFHDRSPPSTTRPVSLPPGLIQRKFHSYFEDGPDPVYRPGRLKGSPCCSVGFPFELIRGVHQPPRVVLVQVFQGHCGIVWVECVVPCGCYLRSQTAIMDRMPIAFRSEACDPGWLPQPGGIFGEPLREHEHSFLSVFYFILVSSWPFSRTTSLKTLDFFVGLPFELGFGSCNNNRIGYPLQLVGIGHPPFPTPTLPMDFEQFWNEVAACGWSWNCRSVDSYKY